MPNINDETITGRIYIMKIYFFRVMDKYSILNLKQCRK